MGATRNNYENLLDLFDNLCNIKNNNSFELNSIKRDIVAAIKKIKQFHLFDLRLSELFYETLESPVKDFEESQRIIAKELFVCLGELLYTFEAANHRRNYGLILELSRTQLPFKIAANWGINKEYNSSFSTHTLFFDLNKKWLDLETEIEYNDYRNYLFTLNKDDIKATDDEAIPKGKYDCFKEFFEKKIDEYRDFIRQNYLDIKDEFRAFNASVRVYIIPQIKSDNDIIHQVNIYKNFDNNRVFIYPYYIDFADRFSNLEELERKADGGYIGLFNEDHLDKYGHNFSKKDIYHELHQIFIKKANHKDLTDYLMYLLRGKTMSVFHTKEKNVLRIYNNRDTTCLIFFDSVPNIEQLKQHIDNATDKPCKFIAFKVRPDKETITLLKEKEIEYFDLENMGRTQVNIDNGEMVHWFIKDRLTSISYHTTNNNYSIGDSLLKRFDSCPNGISGWLEYENLCTDVFCFLFKDDFRNFTYRTQSYTHDKIFRRDLIINNNYVDVTGFWAQIKSEFNSNLIVIDFKNYSDTLEQNEFYLPSKYLNLISGKFAIICSRNGLGNSAKILQRKMFNRDKEFILCLTDTDMKEMIREKMVGQDPTYRLENQKFMMYELE